MATTGNADIWLHARGAKNTARTHTPQRAHLAAIKRFFGCALAILVACSALAAVGALKAAVFLSHFNY
jgi:hypothetical protein